VVRHLDAKNTKLADAFDNALTRAKSFAFPETPADRRHVLKLVSSDWISVAPLLPAAFQTGDVPALVAARARRPTPLKARLRAAAVSLRAWLRRN
jgi:hypothetical protein